MIMVLYAVGAALCIGIGLFFSRRSQPFGYMNPICLFCFVCSVVFFLVPIWLGVENEYLFSMEGYSNNAWIINWAVNVIFMLTTVATYQLTRGTQFYKHYSTRLVFWPEWNLGRINIKAISFSALIPASLVIIILALIFRDLPYFELLSNRTKLFSGYGYLFLPLYWFGIFLLIYFVYIFVKYDGSHFILRLFLVMLPVFLFNTLLWVYLGSRSKSLISLFYILLIYFILEAKKLGQFRRLLIILIIAMPLICIGIISQQSRQIMAAGQEVVLSDLDTSISSKKLLTGVTFFGQTTEYNLWLIDNVGFDDALAGKTFLALITGFVPRGLWPGKPTGAGPHLRNLIYPGSYDLEEGAYLTSYSPGILAESLMNFLWLGAFVGGIIFGILLTILSFILRYVNDPCTFVIWFVCAEHVFGMLTGEVFGNLSGLIAKVSFFAFLYIMRILGDIVRTVCRVSPANSSDIS